MSLRKKPISTGKRIAASRANGSRSHGPTTPQGKKRIRKTNLRHGFYSQAEGLALSALGEDPEQFDALVKALMEKWQPADGYEKLLVMYLARAMWAMERSQRMQEGCALRRAKDANLGRENRMHAQMMRLKMTAQSLRSLAHSVACWHYVTTREDLEIMQKLHQEGGLKEMGEILLAFFYQLQEPGTDQDGVSHDEKVRGAINSFRSIFGLGKMESDVDLLTPAGKHLVVRAKGPEEMDGPPFAEDGEDSEKDNRYPKITEEDWTARERARKLLKNILTRQVEDCEAQRKALLRESLAGPSPYERAAEIAPTQANSLLMRRMQDANFREVRRLTSLLIKIKRQARKKSASESRLVSLNVDENTEG